MVFLVSKRSRRKFCWALEDDTKAPHLHLKKSKAAKRGAKYAGKHTRARASAPAVDDIMIVPHHYCRNTRKPRSWNSFLFSMRAEEDPVLSHKRFFEKIKKNDELGKSKLLTWEQSPPDSISKCTDESKMTRAHPACPNWGLDIFNFPEESFQSHCKKR